MKAPRQAPRQSRGFTLVELLVVITIIAILMALAIPAAMQVLETANRAACQNNIKAIGLAVLSYEKAKGVLPASGFVSAPSDPDGYADFNERTGNMMSWLVLILPEVDEQTLYDQINFTKPITEQANISGESRAAQEFTVAAYLCSSDSADSALPYEYETKKFARGNYAAYVSPYHVEKQNWYPGALIGGRKHYLQDIQPGLSMCILASEVLSRDEAKDERGVWSLPWTGASLLAFGATPENAETEQGQQPPSPFVFSNTGKDQVQLPNNQGPNFDTLFDCPEPAEAQKDLMPCKTATSLRSAAPRSRHIGGVNIVYFDQHVDFIVNNVDAKVYAALISSNDDTVVERP